MKKPSLVILIFFCAFIGLNSSGETLNLNGDIHIKLEDNGDFSFYLGAKLIPGSAELFTPPNRVVRGQFSPIESGLRFKGAIFQVDEKTGKLSSPSVKLAEVITDYYLDKESNLIIKSELKYLTNGYDFIPRWLISFSLGTYDQGKWQDLTAGTSAEVIDSNRSRKTYNLLSQKVPTQNNAKEITLNLQTVKIKMIPGNNTRINRLDHFNNDHAAVKTSFLTDHLTKSFSSKVDETERIEVKVSVAKQVEIKK
jgi:hypothetical protein